MKNKLIVIAGPTAVGKTQVAIHLAKALKTEIVSADSRQFFREMPIGTAAPSENELKEVPHHFIGQLSVTNEYDVYRYSADAVKCIDELHKQHEFVILCGGSGLYIKAVLEGIDALPDPTPEIRASLKTQLQVEGKESLLARLKVLDPEIISAIDTQNPARILRALEICLSTGTTYSSLRNKTKTTRNFSPIIFGLNIEREKLYQRINLRTNEMMSVGLVDEVRKLIPYRHLQSLNTVGYKEIFSMLDGLISAEDAINLIQSNTRKYARKQITWFRSQKGIVWYEPENFKNILQKIQTI